MPSITSVGLHASGQTIGTALKRDYKKPEFASLNSLLKGDEFTRLPKTEPVSVDRLADQIPIIKISGPTPPEAKKALPHPVAQQPVPKPKLQPIRKKPVKPTKVHQEAPLDTPFKDHSPVELGVEILQHHHAIKTVFNSLNGKSLSSDPQFMNKLQKLARLKADQDLLRYEYYHRPALTKKQTNALIEELADHYTFSPQGKRYKYPKEIAKKPLEGERNPLIPF